METRRSPCGERGLKSAARKVSASTIWSLPVRGAWVEIMLIAFVGKQKRSRSPCGERGLK